MPLVRKRRADPEDASSDEASPPPARRNPQTPRQRRPANSPSASDEEQEATYVSDENGATQGHGMSMDQMVKKMVRLALASEYSRQPIRRADIGTKVLGAHGKQFKTVFNEAQIQLRAVFGMEMTELPMREKVTISQRRAAQKTEKPSSSSKSWVLSTTLPTKYRTSTILAPSKIPTTLQESTYTGLTTFVISLISLSGGGLAEAKLERYLKRANADQYTPLDKTDKLLARMIKEGYIVKIKDTTGGDEMVEYMVGPRGKVEVGNEGVGGLVREVYGGQDNEDLEKKIERSLGLGAEEKRKKVNANANGNSNEARATKRTPGRPRKRRDIGSDEEEEEEEAEESEEDE